MSEKSVEPLPAAEETSLQASQEASPIASSAGSQPAVIEMVVDAPAPSATASAVIVVPLSAASPQWEIVTAKSRVDSFNQAQLLEELRDVQKRGPLKVALDLRANRFLSLPIIKFCVEMAASLSERGGSFVLIGCQEKTKRHFEIYGSLDNIRVVRSDADLDRAKSPRAS